MSLIRIPRGIAAAALAATAAVVAGVLVPGDVARADDAVPAISSAVSITRHTDDAGFTHPGIGVTADSLDNTRSQLLAGAEPWTSFYQAMLRTSYASATLTSANQGSGDGVPASTSFTDVGTMYELMSDGPGAYTQAILYYLTGDPVYRENALKIIRIWSHMDPDDYAFFGDAQIKVGTPLYRLIAAAELLRSTSVVGASADGYPLAWTDTDTADFTNNFIVPATTTFAYSNAWYMGQGTIPLMGALAGYIFTGDRTHYDEGVEWFSVNSTAPDQDVNGALSSMFRLIAKDDPKNTYGRSFVQHIEMGRDQAHAGDDVQALTELSRIVATQGTKLDPKAGTVSTKRNAVSPYRFLGDRLLKGVNAFLSFMDGHDVPWIDITGEGGALAQSYRGRWSESLNELYHVYTYQFHVDVAKVAPAVAQQFAQRDGALFYNFDSLEIGSQIATDGLRSFWGGSLPGDDYWLSIPAAAKGETSPAADSNLPFTQKATVVSGSAAAVTEGGTSFLRARVTKKGVRIAVRSLLYGDRTSYSPVGILVRTTSTSTLKVSRQAGTAPYQTLTVPDTGGQWRYISYDMDTSVVPKSAMGDNNIVFYTLSGKAGTVDLQQVDADAAADISPPVFPQGASATLIGVKGVPLTADLSATDAGTGETVTYSASVAPRGVTLSGSDGAFAWTPTRTQVGDSDAVVQADDGTTTTALALRLRVAADRAHAVTLAEDGYDSAQTYTSGTLAAYTAAVAAAKALVSTGSDSDFLAAVAALQKAASGLALLSPRLADGTLDYPSLVTSSLGSDIVGNLVDDDNATFTGDLSTGSFTLDFGSGYRVKSTAFDLQARQTFGNRSQGSNVYGSDDGTVWTKLTTTETTDTNAKETLPVDSSLTGTAYRFLKVQVDDPGVPTDPNYPGIFDLGEFHIHGDRVEAVDRVTSASIASNDPVPGIATGGDTVTVTFRTSEDVTAVSGTVAGQQATIAGSGTSWTVGVVLPATVASGSYATFSIGYTTADGAAASPLVVTTDGSKLFLSSSSDLIGDVPSITTPVSASGELEASKEPYVAKMFDEDASTFSDIGPVNGAYYAILDFGNGGSAAISSAELLVRQDSWGTSRASNLHLEGSNDLSTWTTITNNAQSTLDWQTLALRSGTVATAYRYVKIANTDWINIAELRLHGTYTAPPVSSVTTARIASSGVVPSRAVGGDTVTVSFTTSEAITDVSATIGGGTATVTGSGTSWTASRVLPADATPGHTVPFEVDYAGPNGETRQSLTSTTDASSVFLSSDIGLIDGVTSLSTPVSLTGTAESDKAQYVAKMFDDDVSTFSDVGPVNGVYYIVLDFGSGHTVTLDHAELAVRQDAFGTGRSADLHLEGSNDLSTWSTITNDATATLAWQTLARPTGTAATAYRYLRIANTDWINIAELRLFGTYSG